MPHFTLLMQQYHPMKSMASPKSFLFARVFPVDFLYQFQVESKACA
jgi:hypothetical protein